MASKIESLRENGNRYFKKKDYKKAILSYKEGLLLEPKNINLNSNLAQACLADGSYADAEVHAVVTLALQQNLEKGYYRAAKAAYSRKRIPRALTYLRQGLIECPGSKNLETLFYQINEEENSKGETKTGERLVKFKDFESDSEDESTLRSRSTSRIINTAPNETKMTSVVNQRSVSVCRTTVVSNSKLVPSKTIKKKKKQGPIEIEDIQNDKFLQTVESLRYAQKKLPSLIANDTLTPREMKDSILTMSTKLQTLMKDGSATLEKGLARKAADLFKEALDLLVGHDLHVFGLKEIDYIVLKYSISISWTETSNYVDIVKSIEYLTDIESMHSAKLPAVYYALGNAFFKLNRFKVALDHLERGVAIVEKGLKIITQPWPGTTNIIKETTKVGLGESLQHLIVSCKLYHVPNAICRHQNCLKISTHIIPSINIFYSDPDYIGYIVVICQEDCKVKYHVGCWKVYKESLNAVQKLSDKDLLGRPCLTLDCVSENNKRSVIVKIEIYGEDGEIKSQCSKDPVNDVINIKETKKGRKKKSEKSTDNAKHNKVQTKRQREHKLTNELPEVNHGTQGMVNESEQLADGLKRLIHLRSVDFGSKIELPCWYPHQDYFGRSDIAQLEKFLNPECVDDSPELHVKKDFVFSYFYEFIRDEGPKKMEFVEEKWKREVSSFPGVEEFMLDRIGVCKFLLKSYRFAALADTLCLAEQLSSTYRKVQAELRDEMFGMIQNNAQFPITSIDNLHFTDHDQNLEDLEIENTSYYEHNPYKTSQDYLPSDIPLPKDDMFYSDDDDDDHDIYCETDDDSDCVGDDVGFENYIVGSELMNSDVASVNRSIDGGDSENESVDSVNAVCVNDVKEKSVGVILNKDEAEDLPSVIQAVDVLPMKNDTAAEGDLETTLKSEVSSSELVDDATQLMEDTSAALEPAINPTIAKIDRSSQTDVGRNFEEEIELLNSIVAELEEELKKCNKANESITMELKSEYKKREDTVVKNYAEKVVTVQNQNDKKIHSLKLEMAKKDTKMETLKKKHADKVDKLNKKLEEDNVLLRKTQAMVQELTKSAEANNTLIKQSTLHVKKSHQLVLDTKKALGKYNINVYNQKCIERLESMYSMVNYLTDTSTPTLTVMLDAIKEWEKVMVKITELEEEFQNQYSTLTQQLKDEINLEDIPELELATLPVEPSYPLKDINNILQKTMERLHSMSKNPPDDKGESNTKNNVPPLTTVHANNIQTTVGMQMFQPSYSQIQGPNLYMRNTIPSVPYRSSSLVPPPPNPAYGMSLYTSQMSHHVPQVRSFQNRRVPLLPDPIQPTENAKTTIAAPGKEKESSTPALDSKKTEAVQVPKDNEKIKEPTATSLEKEPETSLLDKNGVLTNSSKQTSATVESVRSSSASSIQSSTGLIPIEKKSPQVGEIQKHIVPVSKPEVKRNSEKKLVAIAPTKRGNYEKLIVELKKKFPTKSETELSSCVSAVREKNKNTLTGLTIPTIFRMVEKVLQEKSNAKQGSMGLDKFGGAAWGGVRNSTTSWNKPKDDPEEECIICMLRMTSDVTSLHCKHTFHSQCIRKWLKEESICPICRTFTRMTDEFPPLG